MTALIRKTSDIIRGAMPWKLIEPVLEECGGEHILKDFKIDSFVDSDESKIIPIKDNKGKAVIADLKDLYHFDETTASKWST